MQSPKTPQVVLNFLTAVVALLLMVAGTACCSGKQQQLAILQKEENDLKGELAREQSVGLQLKSENERLKQTPAAALQETLTAVGGNDAKDGDDADRDSIAKLQIIADRFPGDAVATEAGQRMNALLTKIAARDAATAKAQAGVLQLVAACHDAYVKVRKVNADSRVFTASNRIDWAGYEDSTNRTAPYIRVGDRAQEKAQALLKNVPDPDGTLAKRVESCAMPNDEE